MIPPLIPVNEITAKPLDLATMAASIILSLLPEVEIPKKTSL